jgi:hypothetical protein
VLWIPDVYSRYRIQIVFHPRSEMFSIPDPKCFPSRIQSQYDLGSRSPSASKSLRILNQKFFLNSGKYDPGCYNRDLYFLPIRDPGSRGKKDPGSRIRNHPEVKRHRIQDPQPGLRIWIQHFRLNTDPDPIRIPIQGF